MKISYTMRGLFTWEQVSGGLAVLLIFLCIFMASRAALGYDFSDARKSLVNDLMASSQSDSDGRLAIVYHVENRSEVKNRVDLVQLKKDLAYEMVKSFQVTDPVIIQEIMETNNLSFQQILNDRSILDQFASRAGCSQVLFVKLEWSGSRMMVDMKLLAANSQQISRITMEVAPESRKGDSQRKIATSKPGRSIFDSFKFDFVPKLFPPEQNDSWLYFAPTAILIPEVQSIEAMLWLKHLREVDIRPVRLRYEARLFNVLQLGIQSYAITQKISSDTELANLTSEQGHHSTYLSLKYQIADDSNLPFALMLGIRRRLLWNVDNTDYRTRDKVDANANPSKFEDAKDLDEKNDQFNQITLTAALTGKLERFGLLYNFYLDNQALGVGIKFLLTSSFKLMADSIFYYYEEAQIPNDYAVGIQLSSGIGSTALNYQMETEQLQLGLSFDF